MTDPVTAFYDDLADEYDLILEDWDAAVRRQAPQLAALLASMGLRPPATVLDCTCGIGTQAIGLAMEGFAVQGTDLSPGAVARARREATRYGVDVPFAVADVRALAEVVPGPFDAVLSFDNALAHLLDDGDLRRAVAAMVEATRPGGVVAASTRDYDVLAGERPTATPVRRHLGEGAERASFQLWDWADDGASYRMEQVVLRGADGSWEGSGTVTTLRALRRAELEAAFASAGLVDLRRHEPAEIGFHQPVLVGRRPD